ncbi:MAG: hypothetical protein NTY13_06820 [Chlamydiae bacterium]|nr:hypothetical protein [Chlamydiota bacterium]
MQICVYKNGGRTNDSFKKTPPNAAIVHATLYPSDKGRAQALAVELTNPTKTDNGWTFDMKVMGGVSVADAVVSGVSVWVDAGGEATDWNSEYGLRLWRWLCEGLYAGEEDERYNEPQKIDRSQSYVLG